MKCGSSVNSTSIRSSASSAIHSSVAATAAIGSPTYRTFSRASASSSWLTGRIPNLTWPLTLPKASGLVSGLPTTENASAIGPSRHRQLNRLEDFQIAGAAAENAGERRLDRLARGSGLSVEQGLGGEQHGRGAVAA